MRRRRTFPRCGSPHPRDLFAWLAIIGGEEESMTGFASQSMKALTSLVAALFLAGLAHAQDPAASFPSRPIRIFGQGMGSTADYLSRYLSQRLHERWGQPV